MSSRLDEVIARVRDVINEALALRKSDVLPDWYVIERKEHDGRTWEEEVEPNCWAHRTSARISDACIEGTSAEMRAIAEAIKTGEPVSFRRCAVEFRPEGVLMWSPRNSKELALVSRDVALALVQEIEKKLAGTQPAKEQA